jgi:hypothetical protein
MNQFSCSNCGYDMTGVETWQNTLEMPFYFGATGYYPIDMMSFYNMAQNTMIQCPNCGKVVTFNKSYS